MSGRSLWIASHADLLLNGSADFADVMPAVVIRWTTESSIRFMDMHIWQRWSVHVGALRLAKSYGRLVELDKCRTDAWYLLTTDRNIYTRGLVENSPRHTFSYACTHGLLSVRTVLSMKCAPVDWNPLCNRMTCQMAVNEMELFTMLFRETIVSDLDQHKL